MSARHTLLRPPPPSDGHKAQVWARAGTRYVAPPTDEQATRAILDFFAKGGRVTRCEPEQWPDSAGVPVRPKRRG